MFLLASRTLAKQKYIVPLQVRTRITTELYTYRHTNLMKNETKKKIIKLSCLLGVLHHVIIVTLDG